MVPIRHHVLIVHPDRLPAQLRWEALAAKLTAKPRPAAQDAAALVAVPEILYAALLAAVTAERGESLTLACVSETPRDSAPSLTLLLPAADFHRHVAAYLGRLERSAATLRRDLSGIEHAIADVHVLTSATPELS